MSAPRRGKDAKGPKREEAKETKPARKPGRTRRRAARLGRFLALLSVVALAGAFHAALRDIAYRSTPRKLAQQILNGLASASLEQIGDVDLDWDGNIVVHDVLLSATREGRKHWFCRAERVVLAFDGWPLRDRDLTLARVDFYGPEIFVRRERSGVWNLTWILRRPPPPVTDAPEEPPPPPKESEASRAAPRDPFPFNGIHLHEATVHFTLESRDGREVTWTATGVSARIERREGLLRFSTINGDFYGGRILAEATVHGLKPLDISARIRVSEADVGRLGGKASFLKNRPVSGRFDGIVALSADPQTRGRIVAAGQAEIQHGNLFELPAFTGLLGILALDPVPDRIVHSAQLAFTVERDRVRIDEMNFLGRPVSLFGEGEMTLTGEDMRVVFVPRLGMSWSDILPIIGAPIQLLSDVAKGALIPIVVRGPFWAPVIEVAPEEKVSEPVRKAFEEPPPVGR